jgi:PTH1 family peptidyl-tRNA hydrolase
MKLLVGLGNPGSSYEKTRHNIGFWVIEELSRKHNVPLDHRDPLFIYGEGRICGKKVVLVKPTTFMNRSGKAVQKAAEIFIKGKPKGEDIWLLHDDIDLNLNRIKLKRGGSDGGHRGLESIRAHCGEDTLRIRLGVGRPTGRQEISDYVLEDFLPGDLDLAENMVQKACEAIETILVFGLLKAQNKVHSQEN